MSFSLERMKANIPVILVVSLFAGYFVLPLISSRAFATIYLLVGFFTFLTHYSLLKPIYKPKRLFSAILFFFAFLAFMAFYWDILNDFTFRKFLKLFLMLSFFPAFYFTPSYYSFEDRLPALRVTVLRLFIFMLLTSLGILLWSTNPKWIEANLNRPLLYSVFIFWGIAYWLLKENKKFTFLAFFLGAFAIYFKSYSETSLLCLLVGGGMLAFLSFVPKLKYFLMAFIIFLCLALPFVLSDMFFSSLLYGIDYLPSSMPRHIFTDRLDIWHGVGQAIFQDLWSLKGLLGHGFESTRYLIMLDPATHLSYPLNRTMHPHNIILQIWFELGFVGVLFLIAFLFYVMQKLLARPEDEQPYWFAYLAVLFTAFNVNFSYGEGWLISGVIFSFLLQYFIFFGGKAVAKKP